MNSKLLTTKDRSRTTLSNEQKNNKIIRVERGIYSTDEYYDMLEVYSIRYPNGIFTLNTMFSIYGMTDQFVKKYHLVTPRGSRTIKDGNIVQTRQVERTRDIGVISYGHNNYKIKAYDKERLLIELFRMSNRISRTLYKDVINYYRKNIYEDFNFIRYHKYCKLFKEQKMLQERFRKEIQ